MSQTTMSRAERLAWRAAQAARSGRDAQALTLVKGALAVCDPQSPGLFAHLTRIDAVASADTAPVVEDGPRAEAPGVAAMLDRLEVWAESIWAEDNSTDDVRAGDSLRALTLTGNSRRLARQGRFAEALALGKEAVALWRAEALEKPGAGARLAESLRLLGGIETAVGDKEAVATTAEACRSLRTLAQHDPGRFVPQLASALHNLAGARLQAADISGAVSASRAAVELRRRAAGDGHPASRLWLSEALSESSVVLLAAGLAQEALTVSGEAVGLLKRLIIDEGDDLAHTLASALKGVARAALDVGAWEEGLAATDAEIALYRELAELDGDQAAVARAEAQHNRATFLTMLGEDEGALASVVEAVHLWRDVPASAASKASLAASLHLAGHLSARCGQDEEAISWFEQAMRAQRSLGDPTESVEEDIAAVSIELARTFARVGRIADAARATEDAAKSFGVVARRRRSHPESLAKQARALLQAGNLHRKTGALDAAIGAYAGVAQLGAQLRRVGSDEDVARAAARKLVICLKRAGRTEEAETWRRRLGGDGAT